MNRSNRNHPSPFFSATHKNPIPARLAGLSRWGIILSCITCLLITPGWVLAQIQIGGDIDGVGSSDRLGSSVALSEDGNRLAVGAPYNYALGGHVRVYAWSGTTWEQLGTDIEGEAANDESGYSVSLSADGNRLAIGAPRNDGVNGNDSGHTRVYEWSGTAWMQLGADIDGGAAVDRSGNAVSLSADGDSVAIGAYLSDAASGFSAGRVRVYGWSGTAWEQIGADLEGEAEDDQFGSAVSLSANGSHLAVGAHNNDVNGMSSGHVRVFERTGNTWAQLGADLDGEVIYDEFGYSVALSANGQRVAVGIPGAEPDVQVTESGQVRVFEWNGANWTQLGADMDGDATYGRSGRAISMSANGNRLAIGAPGNNDGAGKVRVYQWTGYAWIKLDAEFDGEAAYDESGWSVSISADGNRVAIGAPANDGNGADSGHVRVYQVAGFIMNAGMSDAWWNSETDGQGFYITVLPVIGKVSLAWFTYDTELPPDGAVAILGDPGHRWLTALGQIDGNQALMRIILTSGGIFDDPTPVQRTDPRWSDGSLILTFDSCYSGTVEYDIIPISMQGIVPITRVANDNVPLCEYLGAQ